MKLVIVVLSTSPQDLFLFYVRRIVGFFELMFMRIDYAV